MAGFSIISDVSLYLKNILKEYLCPNFISSEEGIAIISPADKNADYQLGIYLYDVEGMGEYSLPQASVAPNGKKKYAPKSLKLKYMIYLNTKAQVVTKGEDAQKILGLVMQTLYDHGKVEISKIHSLASEIDDAAGITLLNLAMDEKAKIWTALTLPMQIAIYLEVSPILLESQRQVDVKRVLATYFEVEEVGGHHA